jgi:hypothetical protein
VRDNGRAAVEGLFERTFASPPEASATTPKRSARALCQCFGGHASAAGDGAPAILGGLRRTRDQPQRDDAGPDREAHVLRVVDRPALSGLLATARRSGQLDDQRGLQLLLVWRPAPRSSDPDRGGW